MPDKVQIQKALVSVSDKAHLEKLCQALHEKSVEIFGTEGTSTFLSKIAIPATKIDSVTDFPEMMEGRVKTLHPKIFGGILARRQTPHDLEDAKRFQIPLFDLVVVNLYPFWNHLGKGADAQAAFIDIGGPALMRAAAKNSLSVTILSDPADYDEFLETYKTHAGCTPLDFRRKMAAKTFERTSAYDLSIASEWSGASSLPRHFLMPHQKLLRYGENPHQEAVWASSKASPWKVLQGKELSYNNLLDAEAAARVVAEFGEPCVCIVKHNNPCGVAIGSDSLAQVFNRAFQADSKSAFGGIVATEELVDQATAEAMSSIFLEVILAKKFTEEAIEIFSKKKNLRLIEWENFRFSPFELRAAMDGWLVQATDLAQPTPTWTLVTKAPPPQELEKDIEFAWRVVKHVRSNAIVLARNLATLGIGAGQTNRVDAVSIALDRAGNPEGAVLASDAFFPFRDNIDLLKGKGIRAIIQPGGSQRDAEVIEAANELGIAMVFTGKRHFRH